MLALFSCSMDELLSDLEVEPAPGLRRSDRDTLGDALRYGEAGAISEGQPGVVP